MALPARRPPARRVLAVGAGKGGVGKSTVALQLALALRAHGATGVLDFDFYGPNIAAMIGIEHVAWTHGLTLARAARPEGPRRRPVEWRGLQIVSAGFILGEDQPLGITAQTLEFLAAQLLAGTEWPPLEYLVVDLPPGTTTVQHLLARQLAVSGAVLVVTPQLVAHQDARKAVRMFRHLHIPIIGGVENLAGLDCPHCYERIELFAPAPAPRSIWAMGVPLLGRLNFDPAIATPPLLETDAPGPLAAVAAVIAARLSSDAGDPSP